jgi:7-cyano-7-deazaguanine synthase
MTPTERAVVLLSGGLDSYTAAAIAKAEGYELYALSVRYGQIHSREIDAARAVARVLGVARHVELSVDLAAFGGSALVGDGAIPKDRALESDLSIPSTYVPARNTVFLSLALGFAEVTGATAIVIGVNALDYSGYPDCRPAFLAAFRKVGRLGTKRGVENRPFHYVAPLLAESKAGIARLATALKVPVEQTLSCYDPLEAPDDSVPALHCGRCDACALRRRGFSEAGLPDPTRYAS